jgi:uncharacterized protein with HEPN domain
MSLRDDAVPLSDMLIHAEQALACLNGASFAVFKADRTMQLACIYCLTIMGEAAVRLSPEARARHSEIPFRAIIGLRNVLIHRYEKVEIAAVYGILSNTVPQTVAQLREILGPDALDPDPGP